MPKRKPQTAVDEPIPSRPHMPGYMLPKGNKGLLAWDWARQRLAESHNYWITTVRPGGLPHTMVVWGLWLENVFYFSTGRQSRKARNLAKNPHCTVCTEHADEAVVVEGEAHLTTEPALLSEFFARYEKKYDFDMSAFGAEPVYAVRPNKAFGLPEILTLKSATRWHFKRS